MELASRIETITNNASGETKELLLELVKTTADKARHEQILLQQIDYLKKDIALLKKKLFGSSSEKQSIPHQQSLDYFNDFELTAQSVEEEMEVEDATTPLLTSLKTKGKAKGRKPLPAHLPRKQVVHELPEEERQCTIHQTKLSPMGESVSEELVYIPAQLEVIQHRCQKYICQTCSQQNERNPGSPLNIKQAQKPEQLIPKSMSSPSLLSAIAVSKFCDHLPLYRQEEMFKRHDIDLSRQCMSQWMLKVGDAIVPLINLLQENITQHDVSFADETTLQVLREPGKKPDSKSYMWCFIGGPPHRRSIIYQYHPSRSGQVARDFFEGYEGAIHCDAYGGYRELLAKDSITGINCMAHVRRKFLDAASPKKPGKGISGKALRLIQRLYLIEETLKEQEASPEKIKQTRQEKAKPILEELRAFLDEKINTVLPKSHLGKAIQYTLNCWVYLITYLEDGRFEIDNNRAERAIKPFVIGRKNWLFAVSTQGAHTSARIYSLIETAKANELNPYRYLVHIFKELPKCRSVEEYEKLLPYNITSEHITNTTSDDIIKECL